MSKQTVDDYYISEARYELLLQAILNPKPSLDPRGQLIETLGDIGGLWPMSCLADRDPVEMAEEAFSATMKGMTIEPTEDHQRHFATMKRLLIEQYSAMVALAKVGKAA